jgi:hypothetical protein
MSGIKTEFNNQWGLVSADGTSPVPADVAATPAGNGTYPLVDEYGRPYVRVAGAAGGAVTRIPASPPTQADAARSAHVVTVQSFSIAGDLIAYSMTAGNDGGMARYLQVWPSILIAPPVGTGAQISWRIPQAGDHEPLRIDFGPFGWFIVAGVLMTISTAFDTYQPAGVVNSNHALTLIYSN